MTSRKPVIAGNWKMNTSPSEGGKLAAEIADGCADVSGVEVIICPPFTGLAVVAEAISNSPTQVGAQNVSSELSGALTGEVSVSMIEGLATNVIVGHSERRSLFGETDEQVAAKAVTASNAGLRSIVCVGESLDIRSAGDAIEFVRQQVRQSLANYSKWESLIVAYEPVWAIGTGEAASPEQAQEIIGEIRSELGSLCGVEVANDIRILYGGSVNANNIGPFLDRPDIDGALVGGVRSLKADEFVRIVRVASEISGN